MPFEIIPVEIERGKDIVIFPIDDKNYDFKNVSRNTFIRKSIRLLSSLVEKFKKVLSSSDWVSPALHQWLPSNLFKGIEDETSGSEKIVSQLVENSKQSWEEKVYAIRNLTLLAARYTTYQKILEKNQTEENVLGDLAAFSLAENCLTKNQITIDRMRKISSDRSRNPYEIVRALSSFKCNDNEKKETNTRLINIVLRNDDIVKQNKGEKFRGLPRQAAYYLAKRGEKLKCVADTLIKELANKNETVKALSYDALKSMTGQNFELKQDVWQEWFKKLDSMEYISCS